MRKIKYELKRTKFGNDSIIVLTFLICIAFLLVPAAFAVEQETTELEIDKLGVFQQRKLTLYGYMDPRLYAELMVGHSPALSTNGVDNFDNELCSYDRGEGRRKLAPGLEFFEINPDKNGYFEITVPIDYKGELACGYRFHSIKIIVRRDKEDDRYASLTVLGLSRSPDHNLMGYKGGSFSAPVEGGGGIGNKRNIFNCQVAARLVVLHNTAKIKKGALSDVTHWYQKK